MKVQYKISLIVHSNGLTRDDTGKHKLPTSVSVKVLSMVVFFSWDYSTYSKLSLNYFEVEKKNHMI